MPCKRLFLLFPEGVLIEDGYIGTELQDGKKAICYNLKIYLKEIISGTDIYLIMKI